MRLLACLIVAPQRATMSQQSSLTQSPHSVRQVLTAYSATTGKDVVAVTDVIHLLQQRERGVGERHAVFLSCLHATGRDGPQLRPHIDFIPGRVQRLAGAGGGKDEKFERAGG